MEWIFFILYLSFDFGYVWPLNLIKSSNQILCIHFLDLSKSKIYVDAIFLWNWWWNGLWGHCWAHGAKALCVFSQTDRHLSSLTPFGRELKVHSFCIFLIFHLFLSSIWDRLSHVPQTGQSSASHGHRTHETLQFSSLSLFRAVLITQQCTIQDKITKMRSLLSGFCCC